jgi:hypothetical protein
MSTLRSTNQQILLNIDGNTIISTYIGMDGIWKRIVVTPLDSAKLSQLLLSITSKAKKTLHTRFTLEDGLGPLEIK